MRGCIDQGDDNRRHVLQPDAIISSPTPSAGGYSGAVPGDQTFTVGITDDGGIALTLPDNTSLTQVGMSTGSAYKEGTVLASLGAAAI
jgi:hypothetical protein